MFGGKMEAGPVKVMDEMCWLNIPTRSLSPRKPVWESPYDPEVAHRSCGAAGQW